MKHRRLKHNRAPIALIAIASAVAVGAAMAAEPVVQGPESVSDWFVAGQQYIKAAKDLARIKHKAKNVILFVGDGMGVSTVTAARILEGQQMGKPGEEHSLFFEKLPYVALSKVYSWDQQTPDSAPTMTGMVTGYKARESMLAVDHTTARYECDPGVIASKSLETILEQAAHAGKDTGVVTTARLTHATPGANYAHTAVRDWESDSEGRISKEQVFPDDRAVVEYYPGDLRAMQKPLSWRHLQSLIVPQALEKDLTEVSSREEKQGLVKVFGGTLDGVSTEVHWLASIALPLLSNAVIKAVGSSHAWSRPGASTLVP